ncbi:glycoside hydrolase family 88 protein [Enterocloster bolteae]|uniref:glycoside hydrolase family 88 protein n=1 Tax=Enterocloster bolteae TaxID=208479 RepID=UPI00189E993F|nr:glycoside hydrolase family 88 protein [Enterocloster bolteae]
MGIENVIKKIHVEPINRKAEYEAAGFLTREEVTAAMDRVADQVRCNMEYFGTRFPSSATRNQTYGVIDNIEWTDGFWTGLLWLCYEYTGDDAFKNLALKNVDSFLNRVEKRIELDHHDLGFLYSLSCVAGYKLTGSAEGRKAGLLAADKLMERFQEKGGFIQAWGELGARDNYSLIIDCLLNIPLLHWAFLETGNPVYRNAAVRHYEAACNNVIRDDASAYHTFYFDPGTGEPLKGVTRQGYSDDSAWARGQAWGIYGIPLNYRYVKDDSAFNLFQGMTNYFLNRLPEDQVCYWDLIFTDGSNQSRDSSAAAIGVCGIHEMLKYLPEVESDKNTYRHAMHCILRSLMERYTAPEIKPGNPVLLHGVYSWHSGKGVDEGNIWGDYYYMEALMRFYKDWNLYW